ncbi:MAG: DNA recombination protein RmuC [Candidatus Acidiferrales bacterium]
MPRLRGEPMTVTMTLWTMIGVALAMAVVLWAVSIWISARLEHQSAALRQEVQSQMQLQVQPVVTQVVQLTKVVTQELTQARGDLQRGLTDSGRLASDAQKNVTAELRDSRDALTAINRSLGQFQEAGRELSQVSQALQTILTGARTRGALGEVVLERMLEDALPQAHYELQYRFASTGAQVDAIIRAGEQLEKIVCVDSKFPREAYVRIVESGDEARKEFAQTVRKHVDSIAEKYILPNEGTLDFALMFVPSESIYYELLLTEDARHGPLDAYCRNARVFPVSPNTLHAYIRVILMGIRGLQMEENAKRVQKELAGLDKLLESYGELFEKLGTHLRNAQKTYDDADSKLTRARALLNQMAQGALPEPAAPEPTQLAFEPATRE